MKKQANSEVVKRLASKGTSMSEGSKRSRNPLGISTRCTARSKRSGEQCKAWALIGSEKCRMHRGITTEDARQRAQQRLLEAADPAAAKLVQLMNDPDVSHNIQLAAAKDILDRNGIGNKQELDVFVKPWEENIEGLLYEAWDDKHDVVAGEVVKPRTIPPSDVLTAEDSEPSWVGGQRHRTR